MVSYPTPLDGCVQILLTRQVLGHMSWHYANVVVLMVGELDHPTLDQTQLMTMLPWSFISCQELDLIRGGGSSAPIVYTTYVHPWHVINAAPWILTSTLKTWTTISWSCDVRWHSEVVPPCFLEHCDSTPEWWHRSPSTSVHVVMGTALVAQKFNTKWYDCWRYTWGKHAPIWMMWCTYLHIDNHVDN